MNWTKINHGGESMGKGRALFIGRYRTWHKGHEEMINQKLKDNIPVLIMIREALEDEEPGTAMNVWNKIKEVYQNDDNVSVIIIPDVESINYGRTVGYEVNEWIPPTKIGEISGTKIRENERNK